MSSGTSLVLHMIRTISPSSDVSNRTPAGTLFTVHQETQPPIPPRSPPAKGAAWGAGEQPGSDISRVRPIRTCQQQG
jgi:hypothetical protein